MNPRGRGCSELRSHHCTPAWVTEQELNKRRKEVLEFGGNIKIGFKHGVWSTINKIIKSGEVLLKNVGFFLKNPKG